MDEQGVPDAVQPEAYFRDAMKCIITELVMGCILLFLEAAIAITEYTIGKDEDKNKGIAKGFAISVNVLSFRLFVFLLCKFHCRAKVEKATLRWKYVYVWIDPMTQEVWQRYRSAMQLLGLTMGLIHFVVSIVDIFRLFDKILPHLSIFAILPLFVVAFKIILRIASLLDDLCCMQRDWRCSHQLFIYCQGYDTPCIDEEPATVAVGGEDLEAGAVRGEHIEAAAAATAGATVATIATTATETEAAVEAIAAATTSGTGGVVSHWQCVQTYRYNEFNTYAARCVHHGCHDGPMHRVVATPRWKEK